MNYSVNDSDVTKYLEALASQSVTVENTTVTGAQNLKKIILIIESDLKEQRYILEEKLSLLNQRKLIVVKRIKALKEDLYNTDSLQTRYTEYKDNVRAVTVSVTSKYMSLIQQTIDLQVDLPTKQSYALNRELNLLTFQVSGITTQIEYLKELDDSLVELKSKIDNL